MAPDPYRGAPAYEPRRTARPQIDVKRLQAGGLATAIVAALIAVVCILVARGVLNIPVLAPKGSGVWGDASTLTYALASFLFGLLATALMYVLLRTTPAPFSYFGWIIGLLTAVAVVLPFTIVSDLDSKIATAIINGFIGTAVGMLTISAARRSIVYGPPNEPELQPPFR